MSRLAEFTIEQWIGLVGLIVFGSVLMYSIVTRQRPPDDRPK
jgi:hypothetical protein